MKKQTITEKRNEQIMKKKRPLSKKILMAMLSVVLILGVISGVVFYYAIHKVSDDVRQITNDMGATTSNVSSHYMSEEIQSSMLQLAIDKSNVADWIFNNFRRSIEIVASAASEIYSNPNNYLPRTIKAPNRNEDGELSLQLLYDSHVNPTDPAVRQEIGLIGNIGDVLLSVNETNESIASVYVATETGFTVQADFIAGKKYNDDGTLMPLDAKERPWYIGAKDTEKAFLTGAVKDVHTPKLGIMCGVPVYRNGEFVAVAGGGMYLDEIQKLVESVDLGASGDACIINANGEVLFSTRDSGSLVPIIDGGDIRQHGDADLARISNKVIIGETGVELMEIDDENCYVAYAPLNTVQWALLLIMPQVVVDAPNIQLQEALKVLQTQVTEQTNHMMYNTEVLLMLVIIFAVILALIHSFNLSSSIVEPITKLTEEVQKIQGNNLDFEWTMDTGDETQVLAESFDSLTERMKQYIDHIQHITAEREKIAAELSLAEKIQYSALPHTFPPFPERNEFDLYASMDPAREVGGDFYDFFLIDDDHLGLVIADVSGKGIPGALFMMTSMVMIRNNAMAGLPVDVILHKTNIGICRNNSEEMFVTVWMGILEISTGIMTCANAGHEYPMIKKPDGSFEMFKDKHGLVIGAMEGVSYTSYQLKLEPGTKIFVYTDGVPEATNMDKKLFGTDRALEALNNDPDASPEVLLKKVTSAIDEFVGPAEQFDDVTMLAIEYRGGQNS